MDVLGCALFPASCSLCGSSLPHLSSVPICNVCWTEFPALSGPMCARCGDSLDAPLQQLLPSDTGLCRACRLAPPPFVRAVAYGLYQDRMKAAIHALKYDGLHPASRRLGLMLAKAIGQLAEKAPRGMLVIPIPLHRLKRAERGFNQARELAASALGFLRKSHPDWQLTLASSTLMRLRATESQAGLTPHKRRINVRGAFRVSDPASVNSKHILIIDDIFTTGATARAAAKELLRAGAASVRVATLARARLYNQTRWDSTYQRVEDNPDLSSNALAANYQGVSIHSSQDQPSF